MSPTVIGFIRTSLLSLVVGVVLGVLIALGVFSGATNPVLITSAHAHANLLGAVMMLIFGVGYHILPRFSGRPLYSESLATVQLWINIAGLTGMVVMFLIGGYSSRDLLKFGVAPFGALYAIGALLFFVNMWRTLSGAMPAPMPPRPASKPPKTD
ncbi:MAG: cbb3-type cytochrome c oxidase subunit I [Actinobacteria bacterium]|nr:cbb3-type cytochrome c oxidase subunit I [Actinomycetota bacterium]MCL6093472.1 cbb3-type cytochrome c oxidase subunit I [Actinomycetota bacterium]